MSDRRPTIRPQPTPPGEYAVSEQDMRGLALRLDMLQTHYRQPKDLSVSNLNASAKTLRRWLSKCVPNSDPPPVSVLEAIGDDLNTPQAITELHKLAKTDGRGLFAGMKFLGLIPGHGDEIGHGMAQEVKTLPISHLPLPQWAATQ